MASDRITVTGMVLSARTIGEYDNRVEILTRERGRISAFARGAKRPKSSLSAVGPFVYGQFELHEGASSYTMYAAKPENYFESLRMDVAGAYYGFYCLEIAQFFTRENNDEWEMLKLLYTTIRALEKGVADKDLIRCIYELRTLAVNGFAPRLDRIQTDAVTKHTIRYALEAPYRQLYAISVSKEIINKLRGINDSLMGDLIDKPIKSLTMLELVQDF